MTLYIRPCGHVHAPGPTEKPCPQCRSNARQREKRTLAREPKDGEFWFVTSEAKQTGRVEPGFVQGDEVWLATWPRPIERAKLRFIARVKIPACPEDCLPARSRP